MQGFNIFVVLLAVSAALYLHFTDEFCLPTLYELPRFPEVKELSTIIVNNSLLEKNSSTPNEIEEAVSIYKRLLETKIKYDSACKNSSAFSSNSVATVAFLCIGLFISYFVLWSSYLSIIFYIISFAAALIVLKVIHNPKYEMKEFPNHYFMDYQPPYLDVSYGEFISNWKKEIERSESIAYHNLACFNEQQKKREAYIIDFCILYVVVIACSLKFSLF